MGKRRGREAPCEREQESAPEEASGMGWEVEWGGRWRGVEAHWIEEQVRCMKARNKREQQRRSENANEKEQTSIK